LNRCALSQTRNGDDRETAQLRRAFGIDPDPVGLSRGVADEFPEAVFAYEGTL
jgi:hypothetical protein